MIDTPSIASPDRRMAMRRRGTMMSPRLMATRCRRFAALGSRHDHLRSR